MVKHKLQVCKTPDFRAKGATGSMPTKAPRASPRNAQSFPSEAAVVLCPAALARFFSIWVDLFPRSPPPHTRRCSSYLSELPPPNAISLHDDVGYAHLAAQGGEEDDELDGVDVVRDADERGFLGFDEGDDVVEAVFDEEGFLKVLLISMSELSSECKD